MRVKVRLIAPIRPVREELAVDLPDGSTLERLVDELVRLYGQEMKECLLQKDGLTPYVYFWLDGRRGAPEALLAEGMEVLIVPPIGGG